MAKPKTTSRTKPDSDSLNRRAAACDRRTGVERRQKTVPVAVDRRATEGADRRKANRRRQIDPTTCERDYTPEELEFMQAMDAYKRANGRMFPTCSEILEVVRSLGYQRQPTLGNTDPSRESDATTAVMSLAQN